MNSQPAQMKQGGDKAAAAGDATVPVFADSLIVAAKAAEPVPDGSKGGRRLKADEDDAKPSSELRDGNAAGAVLVLPPMPAPQEMLATWSVGVGDADGSKLLATAGCLPGSGAGSDGGGSVGSGMRDSSVVAPVSVAMDKGAVLPQIEAGSAAGLVARGGLTAQDVTSSRVLRDGEDSGSGSAPVAATNDDGSAVAPVRPAEVNAALPVAVDVAAREVSREGGSLRAIGDAGSVQDSTAATVAVGAQNVSAAVVPPPASGDLRTLMLKAGARSVGGVQAAGQAGLGKALANSAVRAKAVSKTGLKDAAEVKPDDKSTPAAGASVDAGSGDGMQRDASPQTESSVAVTAIVNHSVAGDAHHPGPNGVATVAAEGGGDTVRTNDGAAPAVAEIAQPVLAINTAKLLHSVGQTEMRVGMRSAEFGNISIRTSSTPELMSAEISVDHSDLARMLATHVPEMQARLGGSQPAHVQIEMSGQNASANGGQANGSAQDAQGSRQQQAQDGQGSRGSNGGGSARRYEREILPAGLMNESGSTRLDVRV